MDILRREKLIDSFLSFMKKDVEYSGTTNHNVRFEFRPSHTEKYMGSSQIKTIPESQDLTRFKMEETISDEEMDQVFTYCIAHKYIDYATCGSSFWVYLTNEGFDRAEEKEQAIIWQNKLQKELIYIATYKSDDVQLNDLLLKAKQYFLDDNIEEAVEKIWDALERVKTLLNNDKKEGIKDICKSLSDEIEYNFFDNEYWTLTKLGNNYQIRHFEKNKKPIENIETKKYLFFRVLSLINLTLNRIQNDKK